MRHCPILAAAAAVLLFGGAGCQVLRERQALGHYVHGQVLAEQGNADEALAELAEAVRRNPKLAVAHAAMGDIHRKKDDPERARDSYENACQADPYSFRPHYNLAVTYQVLAQAARAVAKAEEYIRQAVRVYLRALAIEPTDFESNLNLAACYFQLGKSDLAEQYALAAIRIDPNSPQAHSNLGVIYDSQDRLWDAIREYKASLELDTQQPQLIMNLGATCMRQQRYQTAIGWFEIAARQDANLAAAHEQIGACYFQHRYFEKSLKAYEQAAAVEPGSAAAPRGIGAACMSLYILDRTRLDLRDRALEAWHRSLELRPDQKDLIQLLQKYTPRESPPQL